jgi:hypothetical protein
VRDRSLCCLRQPGTHHPRGEVLLGQHRVILAQWGFFTLLPFAALLQACVNRTPAWLNSSCTRWPFAIAAEISGARSFGT